VDSAALFTHFTAYTSGLSLDVPEYAKTDQIGTQGPHTAE
jgi:hypothetical protein